MTKSAANDTAVASKIVDSFDLAFSSNPLIEVGEAYFNERS